MTDQRDPANLQAVLQTRQPVQQVLVSLDDLATMLGRRASAPPAPIATTPLAPLAATGSIEQQLAASVVMDRIAALEAMLAEARQEKAAPAPQPPDVAPLVLHIVNEQVQPLHEALERLHERPPPSWPPQMAEQVRELADRVAAVERNVVAAEAERALAPANDDGDNAPADLPAFLTRDSRPAPRTHPPPIPVAPPVDLAPLHQQLHQANNALMAQSALIEALSARLERLEQPPAAEPEPPVPTPREAAIARVRAAARDRRARELGSTADEPGLLLRLVETAHYARAAQPGPMDLMGELAAVRGSDWETVAEGLIQQSDQWARVAIRAIAIEEAAVQRIGHSPEDEAERAADAAVAAIEGL